MKRQQPGTHALFSTLARVMMLALPLALLAPLTASTAYGADWMAQVKTAHDAKKYTKVRDVLDQNKAGNDNNVEWLWRRARAEYDLGNQFPDDDPKNHKHMYAGFDFAQKALATDASSAKTHTWYAILIGKVGLIEGTEAKIKNSYKVKEHALKAIELDPKDEANYHLMGRWHYTLADLSWLERKIASLIYATPPKASFPEAVTYFQGAIKLDPQDVQHYLWLGKSQLAMDKDADAKATFTKAMTLPTADDAEKRMQQECKELLEDL